MEPAKKDKYILKEINSGPLAIKRYFSQSELNKLHFVDPLFFLDNYLKSGDSFGLSPDELVIYTLNASQKIFNIVLRRFFKTSLVNSREVLVGELYKFCIFREVITRESAEKTFKKIINMDLADLIIYLYNELQTLKKEIKLPVLETRTVAAKTRFDEKDFKKYSWQYSVLGFLQREAEKNPFIQSFLIHGSFATKDFLENWSDLDTLVILDDKIFGGSDNIKSAHNIFRKIALLFYKIDPLAHHEFTFMTGFDLDYYSSSLFPPVIYDYSLLISGKKELKISIHPDDYEKIHRMAEFVNYFRNKILLSKFSANKYFWKNDLAFIMMWPSFMLQAENLYLYKKYSFEKAKEKFPSINFSVVDGATSIMKNWKRFNLLRCYPNVLINLLPYGINEKLIYLFRHLARSQSPEQSNDQIKAITEDALKLMESSLDLCLKNKSLHSNG